MQPDDSQAEYLITQQSCNLQEKGKKIGIVNDNQDDILSKFLDDFEDDVVEVQPMDQEVANEYLWNATKKNKCKRNIVHDSTCGICGNSDEDEYHAVVACTKSRALRHSMRDLWSLPDEKSFWYTGDDWLQVLLDPCTEEMRAKILLLLWRAWYLRDDCVHGKGKESIMGSVQFLHRYQEELTEAEQLNISDKGKNMWSMASHQPTKPVSQPMLWLSSLILAKVSVGL